jgi:hypothetical protein
MLNHLIEILVLAATTGTISVTITRSKVFKPLREWLKGRTGRIGKWFAGLFSCWYCMSHWVAFAATTVWQPVLIPSVGNRLVDLIPSAFLMIGLSAFACCALVWTGIGAMDTEDEILRKAREIIAVRKAEAAQQRAPQGQPTAPEGKETASP